MLSGNFSIIKKEKSFCLKVCALFCCFWIIFVIFKVSFLCKFTQPQPFEGKYCQRHSKKEKWHSDNFEKKSLQSSVTAKVKVILSSFPKESQSGCYTDAFTH